MRGVEWGFWVYNMARAIDRSCVVGAMVVEAGGEKLNAKKSLLGGSKTC